MAELLTEDDIKMFLSIDPDEESVRKAVEQINKDIEAANVKRIRMEIESIRPEPSQPFLQKRYGRLGEVAQATFDKTQYGEAIRQVTRGLKGDESAAGVAKGIAKQLGSDLKTIWQGLTGSGGKPSAPGGSSALPSLAEAQALAKSLGLLAAAPFRAVNAGLDTLRNTLLGVQSSLGGIGVGLNLVDNLFGAVSDFTKKIPVIGELLGPVLDQLGKMPRVLNEILQAGLSLVSKASPGVMKQLSIALEDAMATIGQAFIPVVEEMIPVIRELGTIIAQALPADEEMREMFRGLFESIRDLVKELAPLAGPLLKAIVGGVKALVDTMTTVAKVLVPVLRPIIAIVNVVVSVLGTLGKALGGLVDYVKWAIRKIPFIGKWLVGDDEGEGKEKRQGISAARTPFMGGIEDYQRRLQMQTAQGPGSISAESVPKNVNAIAQKLDNIDKWFQKMTPEKFGGIVKDSMRDPNAARKAVDAAELGMRRK